VLSIMRCVMFLMEVLGEFVHNNRMEDNLITDEMRAKYEAAMARQEKQRKILGSLEDRLGLPVGFIYQLGRESNDWAYIVKLAVFVEAAVTASLVLKVGDERMYEHFSRINNSQRLDLALSLNLISDFDKKVLTVLATVRNSFAHDVKNLTGSLSTYISGLSQQKKFQVVTHLVNFERSRQAPAKITDNFDWLSDWFRILLDVAIIGPLTSLANHGLDADSSRAIHAWLDENWTDLPFPRPPHWLPKIPPEDSSN
jgi:hypothetical protein